jgi:hypothetical protein
MHCHVAELFVVVSPYRGVGHASESLAGLALVEDLPFCVCRLYAEQISFATAMRKWLNVIRTKSRIAAGSSEAIVATISLKHNQYTQTSALCAEQELL